MGQLAGCDEGQESCDIGNCGGGGSTLGCENFVPSVRKVSREISSVSQAQESVTGDCQCIFDPFFFLQIKALLNTSWGAPSVIAQGFLKPRLPN